MRFFPCFLCKILLPISILANAALYFGLIDVGQYRNYVNKAVQTSIDISQDETTKTFSAMIKKKFSQNFSGDLDKLKKDLGNLAADKIKEQIKAKSKNLSEEDLNQIVKYIKQ